MASVAAPPLPEFELTPLPAMVYISPPDIMRYLAFSAMNMFPLLSAFIPPKLSRDELVAAFPSPLNWEVPTPANFVII